MRYYVLLLFGLLGIHLFLLANLQFTAWPEMLSYPYLRNHGFLIYRDMIAPYPPILIMGLSWIYALFGYHLWVLKTVAWGVILSSSVLIFLITRKITKSDKFALTSLGIYVILQPFLEGNMLWFDLAIIPPLLLSLFFLLRNNLFLTGLFLAVAVLIKQTTGLYLVLVILYLVFVKRTRFSELKKIFYGSLLLGVPLLVRLVQEGALSDFINWVLVYPLTKWGSIIGYVRMEMTAREVVVILILISPIILKLRQVWEDKNLRIILLFFVCALVAVYPRFSFFHFQTALALLVIMYGYLLSKTKLNSLFVVGCLLIIAFLIHGPVIARDWQKEARFYDKDDLEMSGIIKNKVSSNERVYLFGVQSGLYAISDRIPSKRWTDNFAWYLEIPGVQEEVIDRWQANPPEFVVWRTPQNGNPFDLGTYQPKKIEAWINTNYTKREEVVPGLWLWQVKRDLP